MITSGATVDGQEPDDPAERETVPAPVSASETNDARYRAGRYLYQADGDQFNAGRDVNIVQRSGPLPPSPARCTLPRDTAAFTGRGDELDRWRRAAATGAHLVWRVKNGAWSLPARLDQTLTDRSALVELVESNAMLGRRRKTSSEPDLTRLAPITARLVEFTVTAVTAPAGPKPAGTGY